MKSSDTHFIFLISILSSLCALTTACDDESSTAHTEICIGPHCPCTVTDDCRSPSKKCYEGTCYDLSEMCGDIVCSETQVCQDNACVDKTEQKCGDEVCGSNQKCYQNKCHDNSEFCGDIICGETQTCQNGSCIENTDKKCGDEICEASQKCYEGACHDDSEFCGDIICGETQTCQNGSCVDSTGESCGNEVCGNDQKCFEGACHDNSEFCGETICGETQTCQDGSCVDQSEQKCGDKECDAGQKCFEDECHDISEFCADVICSTNQECFEETCHDRCGDHICETDQKCWENNCYSISAFCGNTVCDSEHACFEGKCVESALICDDKLCQTGQKCYEKVCHDDKDFCGNVICGKNQTCVEDLCIDDKDLCGGILCEADQKCYQDKCHDNTEFCDKVICGKDQTCVNKKCIDNKDLCKDTVCSTNQKCYQDKCYDTSEFCGDVICTKDQVCENKKCITPVKSIEFTTTDTKLFFNEELKLNVKVTPSNATDKTLVWTVSVTGPSGVEEKVFNKQTAMLTNRTLNVREVKLTVKSKTNPSVTATKTIQFKPYTKDICIRDTSTDQCDKPRILHDASTRPYLPENAYDEETTKVFNRDIYTEYVSKYLQKSGSDEYGNRASVVIAARFLALQFPFYIRYYDNTHSVTKYSTESHYVWTNDDTKPTKGQDVRIFGLNLTKNAYNGYTSSTVVQNNVIPWSSKIPAASDRNEGPNGLACSGFVAWAMRNGRFYIGDWWTHVFGNYGDCTVSGQKVRHYNCENYVNGKTSSSAANPYNSYDGAYDKFQDLKSTNKTSMCKTKDKCSYYITDTCKCTSGKCSCACITDKIGGDTKDDAINDKTDFVNVKYIDDPKLQKKIKAGDLLWHGKSRCTGSGGHIAMILGIDRNEDDTIKWIYVAEAASGGTKVTRYSIDFFQNCSGWSETICEKKDGKYVVKKNSDGSNYVDYNTDTGKPKKAYDSFIIRMDNIYNYYHKAGKVSEKGSDYKYKEIESFVTQ